MTNTDFPDWSEARSFATELSEIGAPLLRLTRNLGFYNTGLALPASSGSGLFGPVAIDQPGYEAMFELSSATGALTVPFAELTVTWTDSVSGLAIATDYFILTCPNGFTQPLVYYISGPAKGDLVSMNIQNMDPAGAMTLNYTANVNSHIYTWDRILQPSYSAGVPVGYTNPAGNPGLGIIGMAAPSTPAGATSFRLLAVYNGKVMLSATNFGQANSARISLEDPATLYSSISTGALFDITLASGGQYSGELILPNGPVLLSIHNAGGSGAIAPVVSITKAEY